MKTLTKLHINLDSWMGKWWTDKFEFTGKIKYIQKGDECIVEFEIKYTQHHTKFCPIWKVWAWLSTARVFIEKTEYINASKFMFTFEDEAIETIVDCNEIS